MSRKVLVPVLGKDVTYGSREISCSVCLEKLLRRRDFPAERDIKTDARVGFGNILCYPDFAVRICRAIKVVG